MTTELLILVALAGIPYWATRGAEFDQLAAGNGGAPQPPPTNQPTGV